MKELNLEQKEKIEIYVQEVTKRVPQKQRKDIELELFSLIEDQLENHPNGSVEEVLLQLGNPRKLADNYLNHKQYLIGPAYIELYITLLKIVIPSVLLALTIALTLSFITSSDQTAIDFILSLVSSWWSGALQVFAFMTIGFGLVEYFNKGKEIDEEWHPNMLPKRESSQKTVKITDTLAAMIFIVIGFIIFNVTPGLVAIHMFGEVYASVPLLNQALYPTILLWINLGLVVSLMKEISSLIIRYYNKVHFIVQSILGMIGVVIAVVLLSMKNLINPTLTADLISSGFVVDFDLYLWLSRGQTVALAIIVISFVAQVIIGLLKFRHNQ